MARKDDKDSGAQSKYTREDPLFIHKRQLHKNELEKLISEVLSMNKNFRSQYETWETMSNVFSRKVDISIARLEALVQAKKEGAAIPESTQESEGAAIPESTQESEGAAIPESTQESEESTIPESTQESEESTIPESTQESEESTVPDIDDEKAVAKDYYMKWREDLKKTIMEQREKTREWVETWFRYLHRIDEKKEEKNPSWHFKIYSDTICYGLVIILGAIWSISSSQFGVTAKCDKGFVPCLSERVLKFSLGVYNLYLTSHNITTEDTGNA